MGFSVQGGRTSGMLQPFRATRFSKVQMISAGGTREVALLAYFTVLELSGPVINLPACTVSL